ncbi:MAG: LemA family protein [Leptospira sp.]|nr:LemA family protein [Leptospira sp.]
MIQTVRKTLLFLLFAGLVSNCGYNKIQELDEEVTASWAEVLNQYKRRADLVPNLVSSVKGFANQEKEIMMGIADARAKIGSIQASPELINDPDKFQEFNKAQGQLGSALSRLLMIQENYPQLKSDARFADLMAQLEGTENRTTVARNRFIRATKDYNVYIRQFPQLLTAKAMGYSPKPTFTVENEDTIKDAPKVEF